MHEDDDESKVAIPIGLDMAETWATKTRIITWISQKCDGLYQCY